MYISDVSRKLRTSQRIKSSQGYPIGKPPYGYMRDGENLKRWVVDEEAAEIVRRIYRMCLDGNSIEMIATFLRRDKVDMPSVYAIKKGYSCPNNRLDMSEYWWRANMIDIILKNQSYCGDVVNFKTFSKSYNKEYKKRFAWIKYKKITKEAFYKWSERARAERDKCLAKREATKDGDAKLRALKELEQWLRDS